MDLLVVDVQPEYHVAARYVLDSVRALCEEADTVTWVYVGRGLTSDCASSVWEYIRCEVGVERQDIRLLEKDYGWLRPWMDAGIPDGCIIDAVRRMHAAGIACSDDLDEAVPGTRILDAVGVHGDFDPHQLLGTRYTHVCGGGGNECLKEITLWLEAHHIRPKVVHSAVYW